MTLEPRYMIIDMEPARDGTYHADTVYVDTSQMLAELLLIPPEAITTTVREPRGSGIDVVVGILFDERV